MRKHSATNTFIENPVEYGSKEMYSCVSLSLSTGVVAGFTQHTHAADTVSTHPHTHTPPHTHTGARRRRGEVIIIILTL